MNHHWLSPVFFCVVPLLTTHALSQQSHQGAATDIEQTFLHPPASAKPGVFWIWMGSNISKEGITKDLEALNEEGFNRTTMFSVADICTPWAQPIEKTPTPKIIAWTEPWWQLVRHAALESKRLGLRFGMFNCPGYESSGGPWITAELSMQQLCWSQTPVSGSQTLHLRLDKPEVSARGHTPYPVYNPQTGLVEIPDIPARKTFYKDIAVLALPGEGIVAKADVINLTGKMQPNGTLDWSVPAGKWTVYRFGHTTSGTLIQPAQWEATGLECDKMSQQAIDFHMDHVIGQIKKHVGDLIGTGFADVHFDSYEAGTPTWTPKMPEEFLKRRGYELIPWLPLFAGRTIESRQDSVKIMDDFMATIKDLYRDIYFKTVAKKIKAAGLNFICEPYGGPWRQDDIIPMIPTVMTEFWTNNGQYSPAELDATVASLRKSNKQIIEAEAFSGWPQDSKWDETPAWIKPIGDAAFCAGVNRLVVNRFVHQPWDESFQPGATFGQWGSHFDRTQTWWKPAQALIRYWQRCQSILQWGIIAKDTNDFSSNNLRIRRIHRRKGNIDVYFVANNSRDTMSAVCNFKIADRQPELWDPVTGERRLITRFKQSSGSTSLSIDFAEAQSFFVVFRKTASPHSDNKKPRATVAQEIPVNGAWKLSFDPRWGGPAKPVVFNTLEDWTKNADSGIRYFSGTVRYEKTFDMPFRNLSNQHAAVYLDLGVVKHVARVTVNGRDLGVVWTAPWRVKIPVQLLRTANNVLIIYITNVWANRLIGDEQQPADCEWLPGHLSDVIPGADSGHFLKEFPEWFLKKQPRPSQGRYCFTTWNYFSKDSPLVPSGLLGPVKLVVCQPTD